MRTSEHYDQIKSFMLKAGQECPEAPCIPPYKVRELRARLIMEEALETVKALGVCVEDGDCFELSMRDLRFHESSTGPDLEEILDGCLDITVVTVGTLIACGLPDDGAYEIVDRANLAKFGPGGYKDEFGKWRKPKDWKKPDYSSILGTTTQEVSP